MQMKFLHFFIVKLSQFTRSKFLEIYTTIIMAGVSQRKQKNYPHVLPCFGPRMHRGGGLLCLRQPEAGRLPCRSTSQTKPHHRYDRRIVNVVIYKPF